MASVMTAEQAVAARPSEVEAESRLLQEAISAMESVCTQLVDRLSAVISKSQDPNKVPSVGAPEPVIVPLADELRSQRRRLNVLHSQMEELLRRIEL